MKKFIYAPIEPHQTGWFIYLDFICVTSEVHRRSERENERISIWAEKIPLFYAPTDDSFSPVLCIVDDMNRARCCRSMKKNANWKTCIIETKDNKFETFLSAFAGFGSCSRRQGSYEISRYFCQHSVALSHKLKHFSLNLRSGLALTQSRLKFFQHFLTTEH